MQPVNRSLLLRRRERTGRGNELKAFGRGLKGRLQNFGGFEVRRTGGPPKFWMREHQETDGGRNDAFALPGPAFRETYLAAVQIGTADRLDGIKIT